MRRGSELRPLLNGALITGLLLLSAVVTYVNTQRVWQETGLVAHTHEVLDALGGVLSSAKDAETGQRGFLITADAAYLAPYDEALVSMSREVERLGELLAENPAQQARLPELRRLLGDKTAELEETIALVRSRGPEAARGVVLSGRGKATMDALRALVGTMVAEEEGLMRERSARALRSYHSAVLAGLVTTGVGLLLLATLMVLSVRKARGEAAAAARLFEQKELLRTTLASIGDAVITTDVSGRITFLNEVAVELTAWKEADAHGRPLEQVFAIVNESSRQPVDNPAMRALREGRIVGLANHTVLVGRDGRERLIDDSAAPIRNEAGEVMGAVLVFRDIGERRATEAALAERLRLLELGAAIAGALTHGEGLAQSLQRCAEALVQHLDAAQAQIWTLDDAGETLLLQASAGLRTALDAPDARVPVATSELGRIVRERSSYSTDSAAGDARVLDADLVAREGLVSFACSALALDGRVVGVMATYARHPLSETLRDSFAAAARQVAVGIQRVLAEETVGRLVERQRLRAERFAQVAAAASTINSAMTQASVVGVVRTEAKRILAAETAEFVLAGTELAEEPGALRAELVARGGRRIGLLSLTRPGRPFDDEARAILAQLAHMTAIAYENARLYEELRDVDRRKDEFIATLSHELRNPLAPIRNALRILRMAGDDRAAAEKASLMIERQVEQVVRLVDDLLDVSRISRSKLRLRRERVELATVLESALETSRPVIEDAGHELYVELSPEPLWIDGDATRLAQVFLNLLNNAAKYTQPHGKIWLRTERTGSRVTVKVRDNGIGIPAEKLPRIFDLFMQVEDRSLERSESGLGIGLTLVKELVDMHGGSVTARSEGPGTGSEFTVELPLVAAGAPAPPTAVTPAAAARTAAGRKCRILVVDDNRDAVESLAMLLEIMHYDVRTAGDGVEAVEIARTFSPDVVLLDIGLPGLNGYEAAERIRALDGGKDVFLVALTGWGQEEDRRRTREAGFDRHLVKPVDPDGLEQLLREHARSSGGS